MFINQIVNHYQIGNHDQPRVASRFGKDRIDIMNMLVQMLPGTSVTYYGVGKVIHLEI